MQPVFLDFETFWSQDHTLSKMSPIEYVMHKETELISCSVKFDKYPTDVLFGETAIKKAFDKIDWSNKLVIAHNGSEFDHMISAWRLGIRPRMWGCTLAMARPLHAKTVGLSLAKLVQHYAPQLEAMGVKSRKDATILHSTRGKHLADFAPEELAAMEVYNRDDTEQCRGIFYCMLPSFTPAELWHIDCNIRMMLEAEFELDTALLETALSVERSNKHKALLDLARMMRQLGEGPAEIDWSNEQGVADWVNEQMQSAAKFQAILESRGIDVPTKFSQKTAKWIPAIAKTDEAMEELLEHDDEVVATAARARLSAKSTQLETRIQSFLGTYQVLSKLPVPAKFCGADTTGRDSGFLYNMYNLPRVNPKKPKVSDALRNSVRAPEGKVVMVSDLSGIELRVNHTLWRVQRSINMWQANPTADLYIGTAAAYYGVPENEITKEDPRRQMGKVLELSCGFQIGAAKLRFQARAQFGVRLTMPEATTGVQNWRARYPEIAGRETGGWARCQEALNYIEHGDSRPIDPWELCWTEKDAIRLPSGRRILYPGLRQEWVDNWEDVGGQMVKKKKKAWVYGEGRHRAFIYGGKMTENIVQALSRDIIFPNALDFWKRTKLRPKHKVYDELVYLVDPGLAPDLLEQLHGVMRTPPPWWPDLVLWSEGDIAETYGAAK